MPGAGHKDKDIGQRIYSAYLQSEYFNRSFVELLPLLGDITQSAFSMYLNGERVPPMNRMIAIAKLFEVSVEWLYTGRGPRRPEPRPYDQLAERLMDCSKDHLDVTSWILGMLERKHVISEQIKKAVHSIIDDDASSFLIVNREF